jgi:hypothetical protein
LDSTFYPNRFKEKYILYHALQEANKLIARDDLKGSSKSNMTLTEIEFFQEYQRAGMKR